MTAPALPEKDYTLDNEPELCKHDGETFIVEVETCGPATVVVCAKCGSTVGEA